MYMYSTVPLSKHVHHELTNYLHTAFTLYSKVSLPPMLDAFTRYLPRILALLLVSVRMVLLGAELIRGSDEPLICCPSLLHWNVARGLPGS